MVQYLSMQAFLFLNYHSTRTAIKSCLVVTVIVTLPLKLNPELTYT